MNCEDKCYKITSEGSHEVPNLNSTHEEADGHVLLHAEHTANEGYEAVMIRSGDTDVFIMCLGFHDRIMAKLFPKCVTKISM